MRKARLILTWDCLRRCPRCCNDSLNRDAIPRVDRYEDLDEFDEVIITGGEPMLDAAATLDFCRELKRLRPERIVYLYSSLWDPAMYDLLQLIDGIHYTVHDPMSPRDGYGFDAMQIAISVARSEGRELSCRLYVEASVTRPVQIYPFLWDRVEIFAMKEECPAPSDETLLVWES